MVCTRRSALNAKGNIMNLFSNKSKSLTWLMALALAGVIAGCGGGGGGGNDGNSGSSTPSSPAAVLPGAAGSPGAAATNPTVGSATPGSGATNVPTSTSGPGVLVTGTRLTVTFTQAMDPATVIALGTFTLKETVSGTNVPGTVTMDATNTIATFTPAAAALLPGIQYTATVSTAARSATVPGPSIAMPNPVSWTFTTSSALTAGQANLDLGTAGPFAIFSGAAINLALTGTPSRIVGDVGSDTAVACGGCNVLPALPETVVGVLHLGDAQGIQGRADYEAAFVDGSTRATNSCVLSAPADISAAQAVCVGFSPSTPGPVYGPGLYRSASPIGFTGTITLDAGGNQDAVFIFQSDSSIDPAVNSTVVLAGLAQAKNIWWIAGTASTIGLGATFKGTVIASAGVSVGIGSTAGAPATVEGRTFSRTAGVTVGEFTTITVP